MKKNYLSGCMLISLFSLSACAQTNNWNGTYTYHAFLGENVAEDKILIKYIFTLEKNKCVVASQGYQTDEKILCYAEEAAGSLAVKFVSYEDGSTKNIYDVEVYPSKSTLFKLTPKKSALITTWEALAPDETHSSGEYFKKVGN